MGESVSSIRDPTNPSARIMASGGTNIGYATHYPNVIESLYFEKGDGEIFIVEDSEG